MRIVDWSPKHPGVESKKKMIDELLSAHALKNRCTISIDKVENSSNNIVAKFTIAARPEITFAIFSVIIDADLKERKPKDVYPFIEFQEQMTLAELNRWNLVTAINVNLQKKQF